MLNQPTSRSSRWLRRISVSVVLGAVFASPVRAHPACDDRIPIENPARFPFNTIGKLKIDTDDDGAFEARGTAFLVTPYVALTNGHCVYSRDDAEWNELFKFQPALYQDASGASVAPYGERVTDRRSSNTKWTGGTYTPATDVDYGAIFITCPFEELTTCMRLCFEYEVPAVNMSGYPSEDLTDPSRSNDQWRGYDDVTDIYDRRMYYDVRSTGSASGAPAWVFYSDSGERYVVAVNRGHSTECNGAGTRLVSQNRDLIRTWMEWTPTFAEQVAAGCALFTVWVWPELLDHVLSQPDGLPPAAQYNLVAPVLPPPVPPSRLNFQVIEGTFYEWKEFYLEPGNFESPRFIRMIAPEQKWLSVIEARVLLAASSEWVDQVPAGENLIIDESQPLEAIALPLDLDGDLPSDQEPDEGSGAFDDCLADIDGDGKVGFGDLLIALSQWGSCLAGCSADVNNDGAVDFNDLLLFLSEWGPCD